MTLEEFLRNRAPHGDTSRLRGATASIIHNAQGQMVLQFHEVVLRDGTRLHNQRYFLVEGDKLRDLDAPTTLIAALSKP